MTHPTDQPDDRQREDDVERMVLTAIEVARALRLCEDGSTPKENTAAVDAVHRLVQKKKLRPLKPGRSHVFYRAEVARYIREETYG